MGKRERDKGSNYERIVRDKLKRAFPTQHITRGNQRFQAWQPDVVCPIYWAECTHSKSPRINAKIKQAIRDINQTPDPDQKLKVPLIVSRQDRGKDWATIPLEHLIDLIIRAEEKSSSPHEEVTSPTTTYKPTLDT